ncbi:fibronectin type III domain-containing protein [uncultured Desulfobacter sp.]|uniref:fibronectin type III domain-containing protein n=1 Tax=uncultured Desulfobacter sp. TaxID=240139 RepID=UPI0029C63137|nr:chitobiase/beta-hexosaminidase C-terminal domain-containing protein [uncultured Desulfobacter sp.]
MTALDISYGTLAFDTTYYWQVRYKDSRDTWTDYSSETSFTTLTDTEPPVTQITTGPDEDGKIFTDSTIFGWAATDNVQWDLTYSTRLDDGEWSEFSAQTSMTLSDLPDGYHTFSVMAKDHAGNEESIPVERKFYVQTAPEDVTEVNIESLRDRLAFSWTPSADTMGDLVEYRIYFDGATDPVVLDPNTSTWEIANLDPSTTYTFYITAVDGEGHESVGVTIDAITFLANPTGVSADPFIHGINLGWNAVTPSEWVKTYRIYMGTSDFNTVDALTPLLSTSSTSVTIPDLDPDTLYYFAVTAVNLSDGEQKTVSTISAESLADMVPPDTLITSGPGDGAYISGTSLSFAWTGTDNLAGSLAYAHRLDEGEWSEFGSALNYTFTNLAEGAHTVAVKSRDLSGNEDPTPATRSFIVDHTPPMPPSGFQGYSSQTGMHLQWTHSPSADIHSYRIYSDNGTETIDYETVYATVNYPGNSYNVSFQEDGTYRFGIRAVDISGNEEQNTSVVATVTISGFGITVNTGGVTYERGQEVSITGALTTLGESPIADTAVTIDVAHDGYHRKFTAYTDDQGAFRYRFQPRSDEAGIYTVTVEAMYEGLTQKATVAFEILGLYLQPAGMTIDMSMNASRTVTFSLKNIGGSDLTGITYTLEDQDPEDLISGFVDIASLPEELSTGASIGIPIVISSDPGTPPATPAVFSITINTDEGSREIGVLNVRLHEAVSLPVLTPQPLQVGVNVEENVSKVLTVSNEGYADMLGTSLEVHDANTYDWVTILNGNLGTIEPGASKTCQVYVAPPADIPMGTYVIQLDLNYDETKLLFYLTAEVTAATEGQAAFVVHDDTGAIVQNAEVSLISEEFYVNETPSGTVEYNDVIQAKTDADGYVSFEGVPVGDYRYIVKAAGHDDFEGKLTVEPGETPQALGVILVTNLVDVNFTVTETTIEDRYTVTLNVTYTTNLTKPALAATPSSIGLSFFPEETYEGEITIRNTSNAIPVTDVQLNSSELDLTDNEIEVFFENGLKTIELDQLAPGESFVIGFQAVISASDPKLNYRCLGNIKVTGNYIFSIDGEARESTTTTPIPVIYSKPWDLSVPSPILFVNDETDGDLNDLEYQGTTYRLGIKSNRDINFNFHPVLNAFTYENGGPDAVSIISENEALWAAAFNDSSPLSSAGSTATFDIVGLEEALESQLESDRATCLGKQHYVGFIGNWDGEEDQGYLIPIRIRTITATKITEKYTPPQPPGTNPPIIDLPDVPSRSMNEHGDVKIQIDQEVSLEREAFDAMLSLDPAVSSLDDVSLDINIERTDGTDASDKFFIVVTQQSGINSTSGGTILGPAQINWQIIPSSEAGGGNSDGIDYNIYATIAYSYQGTVFNFTTQTESVTVKPMPKIVLAYELPYVIMAWIPAKVKVRATNEGAGQAHNLVIASGQPKIVENENNIPIDFTITGASSTADGDAYQAGVTTIDFGDVAPGATVEGYWNITTTRDGYFIEFSADLKHQNYLGIELDPLIVDVSTELVPAIGGRITQTGCAYPGLTVRLLQNETLMDQGEVNASGAYYISDLAPGDYDWQVVNESGYIVNKDPKLINVLADLPTSHINLDLENSDADSDGDGLPDCWELEYFGNLDQVADGHGDSDDLTNIEEYNIGTDPANGDTDGDNISDGDEVSAGTDPNDPNSVPIDPSESPRLTTTQWEQYHFEFDSNNDGVFEKYAAGCTTVAVGQLINYYLNYLGNDRANWLNRILENVWVYPRFKIIDPPEYWVVDIHHPGCDIEDNYPDDHDDGLYHVSKDSPCDHLENEPMITFLWNVALGLDAEFTEGEGTGVGSYGAENEPYDWVGNNTQPKIISLLHDRFRFNVSHGDIVVSESLSNLNQERDYIIESINSKHPVLISMYRTDEEGNKHGHTALIDQYRVEANSDFKIRINMGWGVDAFNESGASGKWYDGDGSIDAGVDRNYTELYIYKNIIPNVNEIGEDADGDNIIDSWEYEYFNDLSRDGTLDFDGDGLTDYEEFERKTNPTSQDTDNDGFADGLEAIYLGTNPKYYDETVPPHLSSFVFNNEPIQVGEKITVASSNETVEICATAFDYDNNFDYPIIPAGIGISNYLWDIDGDGDIDSTTTTPCNSNFIDFVKYPGVKHISCKVIDDEGQVSNTNGFTVQVKDDITIIVEDELGEPLNGYLMFMKVPPDLDSVDSAYLSIKNFYKYFRNFSSDNDNDGIIDAEKKSLKINERMAVYVENGFISLRREDIYDNRCLINGSLNLDELTYVFFFPSDEDDPYFQSQPDMVEHSISERIRTSETVSWWTLNLNEKEFVDDNRGLYQIVTITNKNSWTETVDVDQIIGQESDKVTGYFNNHTEKQCFVLEPPIDDNKNIIKPQSPTQKPLILVHGINGSANYWGENNLLNTYLGISDPKSIPRLLRNDQKIVWEFYYGGKDPIVDCSNMLSQAISKVLSINSEFDGKVDLVTHSYGGVITRYALAKNLLDLKHKISRLMMIGPPHHGSYSAARIYNSYDCFLSKVMGLNCSEESSLSVSDMVLMLQRLGLFEKSFKDPAAPIYRDLSPGSVSLMEIEKNTEKDQIFSDIEDVIIIAGKKGIPIGDSLHNEAEDFEDGVVSISSASLLDNIKVGIVELHHIEQPTSLDSYKLIHEYFYKTPGKSDIIKFFIDDDTNISTLDNDFYKGGLVIEANNDVSEINVSSLTPCGIPFNKKLKKYKAPDPETPDSMQNAFFYYDDGEYPDLITQTPCQPLFDKPTGLGYYLPQGEEKNVLIYVTFTDGTTNIGFTSINPCKTKIINDIESIFSETGLDSDMDGLDDFIELIIGTNPMDQDTDDDAEFDGSGGSEDLNNNGIVDFGETDPLNPDTDGDGIYDGTEKGVTTPITSDTDLSAGHFIADADPTTTSDPTDADTDDDGIIDGNEDKNYNGLIESALGETDPNNPDTDGDGIYDGTEIGLAEPQDPEATDQTTGHFVGDADPTTTTDPNQADSDGDGVIDGDEDINGDGAYNPEAGETDPSTPSDADNDGMNDQWELDNFGTLDRDGTGDFDGDGISDLDEYLNGTDPDVSSAPSVPQILSPADQAEVTVLQPTLSIINSVDPNGDEVVYDFELYADAAMTQLLFSALDYMEDPETTTLELPDSLEDNTWYYWRVRATDGAGFSQWAYGRFFVNTVNDAPGEFFISNPQDDSDVDTQTPVLEVTNSVDMDGDEITCTFEVYADSSMSTLVASGLDIPQGQGGTTSWTVDSSLDDNTWYFWKAIAMDAHGAATETLAASFFVNTENEAPEAPVLSSPAIGSEVDVQGLDLIVTNAFDPDGDLLTYFFELDKVDTFDNGAKQTSGEISEGLDTTSWYVADLEDNTTFFWRAKASDGYAESPWAQGNFFVNTFNDEPSIPTLKNPGEGAWVETLTPKLALNPSVDIDNDSLLYRFEIYSDLPLTDLVVQGESEIPEWVVSSALNDNTWYFWKAQAEDEHGTASAWMNTASFFVNNNGVNDLPEITIIGPSNNMITNGSDVIISWEDSDSDSNADIALYYDTDSTGEDGILIVDGLKEDPDGQSDAYLWDITEMADGAYYVYAVVTDETAFETSYGLGTITIDTTPPTVTAIPAGGNYDSVQEVTLQASETAEIYYTMDNTEPTTESALYALPIEINEATGLKFIAVDEAGNPSEMITEEYTINTSNNIPPVADAGEDLNVNVGETVLLDGSASSDFDDGPQPLSFNWKFVSVPNGCTLTDNDIADSDNASASFLPDTEGIYILELTVEDGEGFVSDQVEICCSVLIQGDLNGDGLVNMTDVTIFRQALGTAAGDPEFNPASDFDNDGRITLNDYRILRSLLN